MKRVAIFLVAMLLAIACTPDKDPVAQPDPTPAPTVEPTEPTPAVSPSPKPSPDIKPVARVAGIDVFELPDKLQAKCREVDRETSFRVLCPSVFPERTKEPVYPATARVLKDGKRFYGLEIGYSAAYGNPKKNRPEAFVHFLVMNGDQKLGGPSIKKFKNLGKRKFGARRGRLYRAAGGFSIHFDHYVFVWLERKTPYIASLHRWDRDQQTLALLARLVGSLRVPK
jgi:hypothetical protein